MIVSDIDTMADDYYAGEYEGNENALKRSEEHTSELQSQR